MNLIMKKKGFALIFSLLISSLTFLIVITYSLTAMNDLVMAERIANSIRAYYAADAGLADAFTRLRVAAYPAAFNTTNDNYPVGPSASCTGSYNVNVATDGAGWPIYTIRSTGTYHGATKTLRLQVRGISFSRWAYLSNTERDPVWGDLWFITGMLTVGPCHTNGRFNIYGTPVFDGPVSQVASSINYYHGGPPRDNPDFQHGLTLNAPALSLPVTGELLNNISNASAQPQGLSLNGNTTINLLNNGTMNVTNAAKKWNNQNVAIPANSALFVNRGNVTVGGTLNGRLTIGSNQNIYINNNILYNSDPRINPASADLLGLVAQNNVIVTATAPFNITIEAYIVALSGSFQVQNFYTFLKGDLVQFGGLTNNVCGPTGMFNPSTGRLVAGYNQLQFYDERLANLVPPWFTPARDANNRLAYLKLQFNEI